jgi:hypothetical protein
MCLFYSGKALHTTDFAYDSALMWAACYGEISSGMFVLLLPVLPRFVMHLRDSSFATFLSSSRGVTEIEPSRIGPASARSGTKEPQRKHSLWHVSYTEHNSDEDMVLTAVGSGKGGFEEKIAASSSVSRDLRGDNADGMSTASTVTISPFDEADMMEIGRAVTKDM